jgi:hypothetical protein
MKGLRSAIALLALVGCKGGDGDHPDALLCFADPPCAGRTHMCSGKTTYRRMTNIDCHATCGPGPCTGGTCGVTGPELTCPDGTVCVDPVYGKPAPPSPCVAESSPADGGPLVLVAQEGHACSIDPTEDPQLFCTRALDLVCISTYRRLESNPDGGNRPVYLCRQPCERAEQCPQPNDICCPGQAPAVGRQNVCVPASSCEAADAGP